MLVVLFTIVMSVFFAAIVASGGGMDFAAREVALRRKVSFDRPNLGAVEPRGEGIRADFSEGDRPSYRSIVVGVDGTPRSKPAVEAAARIARDAGAALTVTCAYDGSAAAPCAGEADLLKGDAYAVSPATAAEEILHAAAEQARAQGAGWVVRSSRYGAAAEALLTSATDAGAELIVVGDDTRHGPWARRFGSFHSEVVRRSRADVLIVRTVGR